MAGSGIGVLIQSISGTSINVNVASGAFVIADVEVVVSSGMNVIIQSGSFVQTQSGIGVIISGQTVAIQSGSFVQTQSGIGVVISGQTVAIQSGSFVNIGSDNTVVLASGGYVNIGSGVGVALVSGGYVNIGSGVGVIINSGTAVFAAAVVPSKVSAGMFPVNASGQQFPPCAAKAHTIRLVTSGVMYVGGVITVDSGNGFMLFGDPRTQASATLDNIELSNLNLLFGKMDVTSGDLVQHISYQW